MFGDRIKTKNESTTRNIYKPGDVGNFKLCTFNKNYNGLISRSFKMPNAQYSNCWRALESNFKQS